MPIRNAIGAALFGTILAALPRAAEVVLPPNLAVSAEITADSEYNGQYRAQNVADGKIPAAISHADVGEAWCVQGTTHRNGASLVFTWPAPVTVAEIVYYGRTAWMFSECWRTYELVADGHATPLLHGELEMRHGPQRIALPGPLQVSELRLRFTSSYGGANPGAAEVQIFAERIPEGALRIPGELPESPALKGALHAGRFGFDRLVTVQRHLIFPSHVYSYHCEGLRPGGALWRLDLQPDGTLTRERLVDAGEGIILNADLSYDGGTILFCWKRRMDLPFHLFTVPVTGGEVRQLTATDAQDVDPCWLPDGGIAFLSDRKPAYAYCHVSTSPILYRCQADGTEVRRLSANYLNDFTPSVLADGRILFSRWEYVDRPAIPIQSLWTMNPDGSGLAGFYGNRVLSPATFMEARQVPGRRQILCILTAHNGPCRGAVGLLDVTHGANAQEAIRNLTPEVPIGVVDRGSGNDVAGPYESPFAVDGEHFLVSKNGLLLLRDLAGTGQATVAVPEAGMGFFSPRPVASRPRPPIIADQAEAGAEPWAEILLQDVYVGLEPAVSRGEIEAIAVVQEMEKRDFASNQVRAFGFQFPVVSCAATYAPKMVWGFARVEADGSAHFRAPAGVPLYFLALNGAGRALQRMRTFTHFVPGERQGCVGCHADRPALTPPARSRPQAALRPPQDLEPPDWGVTGFSYAQIVQPVLDRHCLRCHAARSPAGGLDLSADHTDFFNVSYENLARRGTPAESSDLGGTGTPFFGSRYVNWIPTYNGQEANILQVTPRTWGSAVSPLADLLASGHPDRAGKPRVSLSGAEQRRVFTWIDLNVPYYGTSSSRHPGLPGCRRFYPERLDAVLGDVAERRCAGCHEAGGKTAIRRGFYTRITNPQDNAFLLAPLAKEAGGIGACGSAVFANADDPDYQAILSTFEQTSALIRTLPRADMPGGEACTP